MYNSEDDGSYANYQLELENKREIDEKDSPYVASKTIKESLAELREVRDKIKSLKETEEEIKQFIGFTIGLKEVIIDETGVIMATYNRTTREYFDSGLLKKKVPALYEQYVKKVEVRSLILK